MNKVQIGTRRLPRGMTRVILTMNEVVDYIKGEGALPPHVVVSSLPHDTWLAARSVNALIDRLSGGRTSSEPIPPRPRSIKRELAQLSVLVNEAFSATAKQWEYLFNGGHVSLSSPVTLQVGDTLKGIVRSEGTGYSHILGDSSDAQVYLQLFPTSSSQEIRMNTSDGYVGHWDDSDYSDYQGLEVEWELSRSETGYSLTVTREGETVNLGERASTYSFSFDQIGRNTFNGVIRDVKLNDGAELYAPLDEGPNAKELRNLGSGPSLAEVSMSSTNWIERGI